MPERLSPTDYASQQEFAEQRRAQLTELDIVLPSIERDVSAKETAAYTYYDAEGCRQLFVATPYTIWGMRLIAQSMREDISTLGDNSTLPPSEPPEE